VEKDYRFETDDGAAGTAKVAVDMLIDLIEQGELEERDVEIPVRLVQRHSTDRLPSVGSTRAPDGETVASRPRNA
jgi:hypothetical protein